MATTGAERGVENEAVERLAIIRRFEAAGFRAWPATSVQYDGTWAVRLTASHPAKRLNSINPLDPSDDRRLGERIALAARRFKAYGRPLTFRISPLAAPAIPAHLDAEGWTAFGRSKVMRLVLSEAALASAVDQIPLKDLNRFVSAAFEVHGYEAELRPGFTEVVSSIKADTGLFVLEQNDVSVSTAICVHDGALAGLFEVATAREHRGKGFGKRMLLSALKWAFTRGARIAWLQVEENNEAGLALYRALGFEEIYSYHYRRPGQEG
ncbi:GNAT family N-acetyltransferase [Chelativorans sp. AA-79]|uniref:GNAT family N-acetyltransferase n=1 Tax=Chelativorans sp. AA-79 TaxID=3028735 RepID=UPI0023F7B29E|nr:GNAT family N-acetyltransferase [Chelativorans sp. AA-79]WEX09017.1 GNAT family N-acetyltransferase [Chelativorans sp. AA-79]